LVTVPDRTVGTPKTGPVRLWDIETGNLLASHFGREDLFHVVFVFEELGLLQIQQRKGARDNHNFRLRMVDPWTGEDVASFACHVPQDNVWWICTPDGKTTAFVTFEKEEPRIEWRDVSSGKLLHTFPGYRERIRFSADGRRFAASRVERDGND